jgi:hypothetical protein
LSNSEFEQVHNQVNGSPDTVIQVGVVHGNVGGDTHVYHHGPNASAPRLPDTVAIGARNPHDVANWINATAQDDDAHDYMAEQLAKAAEVAAGDVLAALLLLNADLCVSLLANMSPNAARQIIEAMTGSPAWLHDLPIAAVAIPRCGHDMRAKLGKRVGRLCRATPSVHDQTPCEGFYQVFENGDIHWSSKGGAQATTGPVHEYYVGQAGSGGRLGFPLGPSNEAQPSPKPYGTTGTWQRFESSFNLNYEACERLGLVCGATMYWSNKYGAHPTWGGIGGYYELAGGTGSWLGFPVTDEKEAHSQRGTLGWCQQFEGGAVFDVFPSRPVSIEKNIAEYHNAQGGASGHLGFPVTSENSAAPSPHGTTGTFARFEWQWDEPAAIVYDSSRGTYGVAGGIGLLHEELGGTAGWLGFPLSDAADGRVRPDEPWRCFQRFEGGAIFWCDEHNCLPVSGVAAKLVLTVDLWRQIGFPVTTEHRLVSDKDCSVQFFEHGVVTVQNALAEVWIRPGKT